MNFKYIKACLLSFIIFTGFQNNWSNGSGTPGTTSLKHSKKDDSGALANFDVTAQKPYLTIKEKQIQIIADKGITIKDLASLKKFDINLFDKNSLEKLRKQKDRVDLEAKSKFDELKQQGLQIDSSDASYEYYKETFRRLINDKRKVLGYDKFFQIRIMSTPGTGKQAVALLNFILDEMKFPSDSVMLVFTKGPQSSASGKNAAIVEQLIASGVDTTHRMKRIRIDLEPEIELSEKETFFLIIRRGKEAKSLSRWRLVIENHKKKIKVIEGKEDIDKIPWDWYDKNGQLIKAGTYFYYFQWRKGDGKDWKPEKIRRKPLIVTKKPDYWRLFITKNGHPKYIQTEKEKLSPPTLEPIKVEIINQKNDRNDKDASPPPKNNTN